MTEWRAASREKNSRKSASCQLSRRWLHHQPPISTGGPSPTIEYATVSPATVVVRTSWSSMPSTATSPDDRRCGPGRPLPGIDGPTDDHEFLTDPDRAVLVRLEGAEQAQPARPRLRGRVARAVQRAPDGGRAHPPVDGEPLGGHERCGQHVDVVLQWAGSDPQAVHPFRSAHDAVRQRVPDAPERVPLPGPDGLVEGGLHRRRQHERLRGSDRGQRSVAEQDPGLCTVDDGIEIDPEGYRRREPDLGGSADETGERAAGETAVRRVLRPVLVDVQADGPNSLSCHDRQEISSTAHPASPNSAMPGWPESAMCRPTRPWTIEAWR